jgi:hypothetical protein
MAPKKPVKPKERQTVKPASQKAVADTSGGSLASFKNILLNTPERAANNLLNVVKSTPLGIATQTAIKGANTFKEKGYKAAVTEQAKIAGVTLAIEAATAGAGAVGSKVIPKVVQSGLPARLVNIVKRETPLLHGSPLSKLPVIKPQTGSKTFPKDKVAYGWNAEQMLKVNEGRMGPLMDQTLAKTTTESGLGTVYVTMGKNKSNIITDAEQNFMMATTKPQKIVKAFNRADYIGNEKRLEKDVLAALQRAGVKVKPVKPNKRRAPRPLSDDSSPV